MGKMKAEDSRIQRAGDTRESDGAAAPTLDGQTRGKFVLFAIPPTERVEDGPLMRGLLETDAGKINVAGWKRVARDTGSEYLSLKVGNTRPRREDDADDAPVEWLVGPFYGRLFRTDGGRHGRVRYFGFIESAERIGEDARTHRGVYKTHWQVQIKAHPNVSADGRTHYIDGSASPAGTRDAADADPLPF